MSSHLRSAWQLYLKHVGRRPLEIKVLLTQATHLSYLFFDLARGEKRRLRLPHGITTAGHVRSYAESIFFHTSFGFAMGVILHYWFDLLTYIPKNILTVLIKAIIHEFLFFVPVGMFMSCSTFGVWRTRASLLSHVINFGLVPVEHQVLYHNISTLIWNTYFTLMDARRKSRL